MESIQHIRKKMVDLKKELQIVETEFSQAKSTKINDDFPYGYGVILEISLLKPAKFWVTGRGLIKHPTGTKLRVICARRRLLSPYKEVTITFREPMSNTLFELKRNQFEILDDD